MKWRNASEKLPPIGKDCNLKIDNIPFSGIYWNADSEHMSHVSYQHFNVAGKTILDSSKFHRIFWLDESSKSVEEEVIKVLDWVSSFETDESEEFISDSIIICDGQYYWKSDNDGDQPLEGKDLYRIYKKLNPSLPSSSVTGEEEGNVLWNELISLMSEYFNNQTRPERRSKIINELRETYKLSNK